MKHEHKIIGAYENTLIEARNILNEAGQLLGWHGCTGESIMKVVGDIEKLLGKK